MLRIPSQIASVQSSVRVSRCVRNRTGSASYDLSLFSGTGRDLRWWTDRHQLATAVAGGSAATSLMGAALVPPGAGAVPVSRVTVSGGPVLTPQQRTRRAARLTGADAPRTIHPSPLAGVALSSVASAAQPLPAHRRLTTPRETLTGASDGCAAEMDSANPTYLTRTARERSLPQQVASGTNQESAIPTALSASEPIVPIRLMQTDSTHVSPGAVGSEAEIVSVYTVAAGADAEISRRKKGATGMNTARQTARHMDTTDELLESIEQFVASGKVVGIEELHLLRLARQAHDEATLLDYAFALLGCGIKENGLFGQRFGQLMREAEAFRVGMAERQKEAA